MWILKAAMEQKLAFSFIHSFIHSWLCWVFPAECSLSLAVASWGCSSLRCMGLSLWGLLLLQRTGSKHPRASVFMTHGLRSCGWWSSRVAAHRLSCGTWLEPTSPASTGRLLTIGPSGLPLLSFFPCFLPAPFFLHKCLLDTLLSCCNLILFSSQ